jgi:hypothetical protein
MKLFSDKPRKTQYFFEPVTGKEYHYVFIEYVFTSPWWKFWSEYEVWFRKVYPADHPKDDPLTYHYLKTERKPFFMV